MKVLVDTSVWIGHFKHRNETLAGLLTEGRVVCHPHVIVEIACGTPPHRHFVIAMLSELEGAPVATHDEVLMLIERHGVAGRGCGFVDVHLVASVLIAEATSLWTTDRRLNALASDFGRSWRREVH